MVQLTFACVVDVAVPPDVDFLRRVEDEPPVLVRGARRAVGFELDVEDVVGRGGVERWGVMWVVVPVVLGPEAEHGRVVSVRGNERVGIELALSRRGVEHR